MDIRTLMSILQPLIDLSTSVMETNFQFQQLLAARIEQSGKTVDQMTVAELQQLVDDTSAAYQAANF